MTEVDLSALPGPIARNVAARGITRLTEVQTAVLAVEDPRQDLRISSQTGSGKTLAIGVAIARRIGADLKQRGTRALVLTPTRELAAQVGRELGWIFTDTGVTIVTVTGGTSVGLDVRALSRGPTVVVGTPGRVVDHLERGALDVSATEMLVLDEADAMLDLGFRDELEVILGHLPTERTTHLVSATFADVVLELADRHQRNARMVMGAAPGTAPATLEHRAYLVRPDQRDQALVNLLLAALGERTLVFVRTRADATEVAEGLADHGFRARAISGEMTQRDRTFTLEAFRSGSVQVLVATDVAARGLDVAGVTQVIHYDLPGDAEALTHRSGRTGRAGQSGVSVMLVPANRRGVATQLIRRAGLQVKFESFPDRETIAARVEARAVAALDAATLDEASKARYEHLAQTVLASRGAQAAVALLLARSHALGPVEPGEITRVSAEPVAGPARAAGLAAPRGGRGDYLTFRVSWGGENGADPRRLLAVACRRGQVTKNEIGAIRIFPRSSSVDIRRDAAEHFERHATVVDPREPRIRFRRDAPPAGRAPAKGGRPPR